MSEEIPLRLRSQRFDIKDVELSLRIRRTPAEVVVVEIKDGAASVAIEMSTVKDVPFNAKKRRRR